MRFVVFSLALVTISACRSKAAPTEDTGETCFTPAQSMENAKPSKNAAPPYAECAAGVFSHCGGENGERGSYCSRPLDVARTERFRKTKPGVCCY